MPQGDVTGFKLKFPTLRQLHASKRTILLQLLMIEASPSRVTSRHWLTESDCSCGQTEPITPIVFSDKSRHNDRTSFRNRRWTVEFIECSTLPRKEQSTTISSKLGQLLRKWNKVLSGRSVQQPNLTSSTFGMEAVESDATMSAGNSKYSNSRCRRERQDLKNWQSVASLTSLQCGFERTSFHSIKLAPGS